jgi:hypothetical protein
MIVVSGAGAPHAIQHLVKVGIDGDAAKAAIRKEIEFVSREAS